MSAQDQAEKAMHRKSVEEVMQNVSDDYNLDIEFSDGRRANDIVLATVRGNRNGMLALALVISEKFPRIDLELVNVTTQSDSSKVMLAVTENLNVVGSVLESKERRAALESMQLRSQVDDEF